MYDGVENMYYINVTEMYVNCGLRNVHCSIYKVEMISLAFKWLIILRLALKMHNQMCRASLKGLCQPLPCFCLHLGTINSIARNKHQKYTQSPRGIVRLTVEWFLRRENNQWLGWKWITQSIRIFDGR